MQVITLDGPAGVGKSTLARRLAERLGLAYLDTGAMFRTLALQLGEPGLKLDGPKLAVALADFSFSLEGKGDQSVLYCNGKPVGPEIRCEEVGLLSSRYATRPEVRTFLKSSQQNLGRRFSLVAEGRDMGSTVFPDARYKFFLDASPKVRAKRRYDQLAAQGQTPDLAHLEKQIAERDKLDRNRAIAPLVAAPDAVVVDTSNLNVDGVFELLMATINRHASDPL